MTGNSRRFRHRIVLGGRDFLAWKIASYKSDLLTKFEFEKQTFVFDIFCFSELTLSKLGLYECKSGHTIYQVTSDFDKQSSVFEFFHFSGLTLPKPGLYKVLFFNICIY